MSAGCSPVHSSACASSLGKRRPRAPDRAPRTIARSGTSAGSAPAIDRTGPPSAQPRSRASRPGALQSIRHWNREQPPTGCVRAARAGARGRAHRGTAARRHAQHQSSARPPVERASARRTDWLRCVPPPTAVRVPVPAACRRPPPAPKPHRPAPAPRQYARSADRREMARAPIRSRCVFERRVLLRSIRAEAAT